ncbi:MAG: LacI family DNA-binding transcriptional regulator [Candidatus Omnitrophica bacterium]|nr:LacI family DNA-binding transcriptional regulator [Candidatus Omnitrophota bacterium]
MKKRPTIVDVAKSAGVTHSTVSRVINNNPAISQETKTKVLQVISEMRYQPNLIARSLVRKKTRSFAIIAPDLHPHVLPILKGITDTCRRNNYALMLFSTDYWADEGLSCSEIVRNWLVDGVIIYNVAYHKDIPDNVKELQKEGVPLVFIDKYLGTKKVNNISLDNDDAMQQAVGHLVNLGHKKIGMMNGGLMSVDGIGRSEGYKNALKKFGLEYEENFTGNADFFFHEAYEEMKRILCFPSKPDAMICANDEMAAGVIKAAQDRGLRIPQDIAVMGFDDWEGAKFLKPSLTTLRFPLEDIGGKAIDMMLSLIEDPKRPIEEVALRARLIVRESTEK